MICMFLFIYPTAAGAARYLKSVELPWEMTWIRLHMSFATVGIFTTLSMALAAGASIYEADEAVEKSTHAMYGLVMCCLVLSQWVVGNAVVWMNRFFSMHRIILFYISKFSKIFHKGTGYTILFM